MPGNPSGDYMEVSRKTLNKTGARTFGFGALIEERIVQFIHHGNRLGLRSFSIGRVNMADPRGEACSLGLQNLWQRSAGTEMLMKEEGSELGMRLKS